MESISMLLNVTGPCGPFPTSPHLNLRSMANCVCVQECVWEFWTSPKMWGDPTGRSASLWRVSVMVRLDLLSFTCLIRQDSDGHSAPPRKMADTLRTPVECIMGLNLFRPSHQPAKLPTQNTGNNRQKRHNEEKAAGKHPKERRERQPSKRTNNSNVKKQAQVKHRGERGHRKTRARLGEVWCPLTPCFQRVTAPFGLSSD